MDYKVSTLAASKYVQSIVVGILYMKTKTKTKSDESQPVPTVVPHKPFDAVADSQELRGAMRGLGTDEQQIIDILTSRSNAQRQSINAAYAAEFERDLVDDLKVRRVLLLMYIIYWFL